MAKLILKNQNFTQNADLLSEPKIRVPKFSVSFFERSTSKNNADAIVYLLVNHNGKSTQKSLSIPIKAGTLHKKTFEIKGDEVATNRLKSIQAEILKNHAKFNLVGQKINVEQLINNALFDFDIINKTPDFFKVCDILQGEISEKYGRKLISKKTFKRYETHIERLKGLCLRDFNKTLIELPEINIHTVEKFVRVLKYDFKFEPETIRKTIEIGKRAYVIAIKNRWFNFNPFEGIKYGRSKSLIESYLTEDQIAILYNLKLSNKLYDNVRDVFVFQCYTSLAYTDVKHLQKSHILKHDGELTISKDREKTKSTQKIYLFPIALEILKKHENDAEFLCFKTYSNVHHNRVLKELSEISGIGRPISTHWGRRTFSQLMMKKGMSKEALQGALGHSSISITERYYANKSTDRTLNEMKSLLTKI